MTLFDHRDDDAGRRSDSPPLLVVTLTGAPRGKERPRARIAKTSDGKQFISIYTPAETRAYENDLRASAIDAMRGKEIISGPVDVIVFAYLPVPESWSERKKAAARAGEIRPMTKPDGDNILKLLDAFNPVKDKRTGTKVQIVWVDDTQVVDGRVVKLYARKTPGIIVEVRRAAEPPKPWQASP